MICKDRFATNLKVRSYSVVVSPRILIPVTWVRTPVGPFFPFSDSGVLIFARAQFMLSEATTCTMAKLEWNVIVYDKPGSDRSAVREEHVKSIPSTVNEGIVTSAGAIYKDTEKKQFAGSTFHMYADSREEVLEFLKKDIYYRAGIWDLDTVIANPVGIAVRVGKDMPGVKI
uniref:YCII-related domain-containing protein n=2 Tax=Candidozyma auris TaxID=498019 RepID=A0A0L0NNL5_CANAR